MDTNINNGNESSSGEFNGKEKERQEKVKQKKDFDFNIWFRKSFRDLMYGFIVIFLFLIIYMVGQMTTYDMINYVHQVCPLAQVVSASPISGMTIIPPGGWNHSQSNYSPLGSPFPFSNLTNGGNFSQFEADDEVVSSYKQDCNVCYVHKSGITSCTLLNCILSGG